MVHELRHTLRLRTILRRRGIIRFPHANHMPIRRGSPTSLGEIQDTTTLRTVAAEGMPVVGMLEAQEGDTNNLWGAR